MFEFSSEERTKWVFFFFSSNFDLDILFLFTMMLENDSSSWLTNLFFFLQWLRIGLTGNDRGTRIDDEEAYNAVNDVEEDRSDATA